MATNYDFKKITKLFKSDGQTNGRDTREQLVNAALLLMIFERFKKYTYGCVETFLAKEWEFKNDKLIYKRSDEFKQLIKEHGKGEEGQHNNQTFRAALRWFHQSKAIDIKEFDEIERLYSLRNEIGHELFEILADDNKEFISSKDVVNAFLIYKKIIE